MNELTSPASDFSLFHPLPILFISGVSCYLVATLFGNGSNYSTVTLHQRAYSQAPSITTTHPSPGAELTCWSFRHSNCGCIHRYVYIYIHLYIYIIFIHIISYLYNISNYIKFTNLVLGNQLGDLPITHGPNDPSIVFPKRWPLAETAWHAGAPSATQENDCNDQVHKGSLDPQPPESWLDTAGCSWKM